MSKKLEIKQRRREEAEKRIAEQRAARRKRNLVTTLVALAVIAVVAVVVVTSREEATNIGGSLAEAGCDDIETFEEAEGNGDHVETDVTYETAPPAYGPHSGSTQPAGFYEDPGESRPENVLHSLEHGLVAIYYSPDVSQETKDKVEELQDQQPGATIAMPYEGMDKPIYFGAWGASQGCDEPTQEAIDAFRTQFQGKGPEQVGVPTFDA